MRVSLLACRPCSSGFGITSNGILAKRAWRKRQRSLRDQGNAARKGGGGDDFVVAPCRRVLLHFLVGHSIQVSAQIHSGLVGGVVRLLLEIPDWFGHKPHDNG